MLRGTQEQHYLIQSNAEEIGKDWLENGLAFTLAKWGISTTALYRLPQVQAHKKEVSNLLKVTKSGKADRRFIINKPKPNGNGKLTSDELKKLHEYYQYRLGYTLDSVDKHTVAALEELIKLRGE